MSQRSFISSLLLIVLIQYAQCANSCGKDLQKHVQTRVIQGSDIGYYKYPWFGIIRIGDEAIKCGCTLIDEKFALTAASCFKAYLPVSPDHNITGVYTVTLGSYDRCDRNETTQKTFAVQTIYIHSGYTEGKRANNIALVKLSEPATTFEPVCLPANPIPVDIRATEGVITGAGLIDYEGKNKTCTIREGRVLIYGNDVCNETLSALGEDTSLLETQFCAGGAKDTKPYGCGGDLGGPLTVYNGNMSWVLLGIIAYHKCPENENITLYVDVSKYTDWIHSIVLGQTTIVEPITTTTEDYDYIEDISSKALPTSGEPSSTETPAPGTSTASSVILGRPNRHGHKTHKKFKRTN